MSAAGVLRRVVVVPAALCLQATLILLSPALFLIAALMCAVQRSTRPWRSVGLVVASPASELRGVAHLLRGVDDLDGFVRQILAQAYQAMNRVLAVPMVIEEGSPTPAEVQRSDGLI